LVATLVVAGPAHAVDRVTRAFRLQDPAIVESSGLVAVDGRLVTMNDSGHEPELFAVDPQTGRTTSVIRWAAEQVDAEALAPGPERDVWVGDIGDNRARRKTVSVTRMPLTGGGGTTYTLRYPGGKPVDAEALLADPTTGRLYVVSKGLFGGTVYAAPKSLDPGAPNQLTRLGPVMGLVTDGAFLPDGWHVVLRDYGRAVVYTFPGLRDVGSFQLPRQPQGEGLAVASDHALYLSSEGAGTRVLKVRLPARLIQAMAEDPAPTATAAPGPGATTPVGSGAAPRRVPDWVLVAGAAAGVAGIATGLTLRFRRRRRRPVEAAS
jgi:hypothetical protein